LAIPKASGIPKPLVEQAQLEGKELKLQLLGDGLLISPEHEPRQGWQEAIEQITAAQGHEAIDAKWLDLPLVRG